MNSYIAPAILAAIFSYVFWLRGHSSKLLKQFWEQMESLGFGQQADLPAALQGTRPYLRARRGSAPRQREDVLLLFGSTEGPMISVGNGAMVATRNYLQGFLLPPGRGLDEAAFPVYRKSHRRSIVALEKLKDGSQLALWAYPFTPRNLAKVMAALEDAGGTPKTGPVQPSPAAPESIPQQAVSERASATAPVPARYFATGDYESKDPTLKVYVKGFFSCAEPPTAEDFNRCFKSEAEKSFAYIKRPDAESTRMICRILHELPPIPLPPADDRRPLRHWKVEAGMDCPDIKRRYSLSGVFGWPETPPTDIVNKMVHVLAVDALVNGDNSPADADYAYLADVKVTPSAEALTYR